MVNLDRGRLSYRELRANHVQPREYPGEWVLNEAGPIPNSYHWLQGLPYLLAARETVKTAPASEAAVIQGVLHTAEVILLNLEDLMIRATEDLRAERIPEAVAKLRWALDLQHLLGDVSELPARVHDPSLEATHTLSIGESPAHERFFEALRAFDRAFLERKSETELASDVFLEGRDPAYELLKLVRRCAHAIQQWERPLWSIPFQFPDGPAELSYHDFVRPDAINLAVNGLFLSGDTPFTQFRAIHQVAEVLSELANECLDSVISGIQAMTQAEVHAQLRRANDVLRANRQGNRILEGNLNNEGYSRIRDNLGCTSGSDSTVLNRLFRLAARVRPLDSGLSREADDVWSQVGFWLHTHLEFPRGQIGDSRSIRGTDHAASNVDGRQQRRMGGAANPPGSISDFVASDSSAGAAVHNAVTRAATLRYPDANQ